MTKDEILLQVRAIADDPDGESCGDSELKTHLEDVCLDFSRRSRVMRDIKAINYQGSTVTLPEDAIELLRVMDSGRNQKLTPITSSDLADDWDTETGEPLYYLRDLTGPDKIRLYPSPTTEGTLSINYIKSHVINGDLLIPPQYHTTLIWGTAAKAMAKSVFQSDSPKMQQFAAAYEAGVQQAMRDAAKNFSSHSRTIPYRNF